MKNKNLLFFLLLVIVVVGCKKEDQTKTIAGSWNLSSFKETIYKDGQIAETNTNKARATGDHWIFRSDGTGEVYNDDGNSEVQSFNYTIQNSELNLTHNFFTGPLNTSLGDYSLKITKLDGKNLQFTSEDTYEDSGSDYKTVSIINYLKQ